MFLPRSILQVSVRSVLESPRVCEPYHDPIRCPMEMLGHHSRLSRPSPIQILLEAGATRPQATSRVDETYL